MSFWNKPPALWTGREKRRALEWLQVVLIACLLLRLWLWLRDDVFKWNDPLPPQDDTPPPTDAW